MIVKFLTRSAGPNGFIDIGEKIDVDASEARLLIDAGYAEAVEPFPAAEEKLKTTAKKTTTTKKK